ncbi:MAG TPA: terminase family protein [Candidatus Paceibacterota bacterium]|nr:terminase family protein [Candidatus Paceibacterota bacterium]
MEQILKLHPKQYEAFIDEKPYVVCIAAFQSGKSFLGSIWSAKKISDFPDKNGVIAAPTYKILNQSTLEKFFQLFPQYRKYYKQQQSILELPSGGKVFIRSTDEPLGLEGMTLKWAWLDEAGMMNRLVWNIIRTRLAIENGQCLITTTPYSLNYLYNEVYQPAIRGEDPDISIHKWRSIDNPYFPKDFLEKERKRLTPQEFARRYEAEFVRMSGLVYELLPNHIIPPKEINNPEAVIAGIDWGFKNPSAIAVIIKKDNVYYLVDEFYQTEKTTAEIIAKLKEFRDKYHINYYFPDPAEPDRLEEMKREGLIPSETSKDIKAGISYVQELIRTNRFYVFSTCKNALEEFNFYHYDEEKPKEEPIKEMDHLMDAIRYALVGHKNYIPVNNEKMLYHIYQRRNNPQTFE